MLEGKEERGNVHPITSLFAEMVGIFSELGYSVANGPELETEYYNFDSLNIPKNHPAREMWDTFWIKGGKHTLLRTHTSPIQIRFMEKNNPPIKIIAPGKVFRNEATDVTHEAQFYQLEGLHIGEDVSVADMKGVLETILKRLFGDDIEFRYRPSYFPFTEPSLEVDIQKKNSSQWIEILGCGMVHPQLLSRTGIDPNKYQGFAFGLGIDRISSLRHRFDDIRLLYKGDLRLIKQFYI